MDFIKKHFKQAGIIKCEFDGNIKDNMTSKVLDKFSDDIIATLFDKPGTGPYIKQYNVYNNHSYNGVIVFGNIGNIKTDGKNIDITIINCKVNDVGVYMG